MSAVGPVSSGGGLVRLELHPPVSFILRQSGAFRRKLLNLGPLWDLFADVMEDVEEEQWSSRGHGQWAPLAASTLAKKTNPDILVESGDLKDSLTDRGRAMDAGPMSMIWGTDVSYAGYHQDGTPKMPQRMLIDIQLADRRRFEQAQVKFVDQAARETWGRI